MCQVSYEQALNTAIAIAKQHEEAYSSVVLSFMMKIFYSRIGTIGVTANYKWCVDHAKHNTFQVMNCCAQRIFVDGHGTIYLKTDEIMTYMNVPSNIPSVFIDNMKTFLLGISEEVVFELNGKIATAMFMELHVFRKLIQQVLDGLKVGAI